MEPKEAHDLILKCAKKANDSEFIKRLLSFLYDKSDSRLGINAFGKRLKNPVGLAAGFDKNGDLVDLMPCLGFGFIEIGSITAKESKGNTGEVLERLVNKEALVNRLGLPNIGVDKFYENFKNKKLREDVVYGVNIAKTNDKNILRDKAIEDFLYSFEKIYLLNNIDYIALNISCPNTEDGKTFEEPKDLKVLLSEIRKREGYIVKENNIKLKPVLVKISPDLRILELEKLIEVCEDYSIYGYIIGNTSKDKRLIGSENKMSGGISGKPIKILSTSIITEVYSLTKGEKLIIGCGGIFNANDAYNKLKAGANLIQLYTSLIYQGPNVVNSINKELMKAAISNIRKNNLDFIIKVTRSMYWIVF